MYTDVGVGKFVPVLQQRELLFNDRFCEIKHCTFQGGHCLADTDLKLVVRRGLHHRADLQVGGLACVIDLTGDGLQ